VTVVRHRQLTEVPDADAVKEGGIKALGVANLSGRLEPRPFDLGLAAVPQPHAQPNEPADAGRDGEEPEETRRVTDHADDQRLRRLRQ
jgi:hypothetical protein